MRVVFRLFFGENLAMKAHKIYAVYEHRHSLITNVKHAPLLRKRRFLFVGSGLDK